MPRRIQRLFLIIITLIFLSIAMLLILFNIKGNIIFFLTPSEIIKEKNIQKDKIRVGGLVKLNSIAFNEPNETSFIITDNTNEITVSYFGILPDLFKEGSGVVAEGEFKDKLLNAKRVFAKHDENYMPKEISKQLKKSGVWNKQYK